MPTTPRPRRAAAKMLWPLAALLLLLAWSGPAQAAPVVPVEDSDESSLIQSAIRAFDVYLGLVDGGDVNAVREHVLDPGYTEGRMSVAEKLLAFIHARLNSSIQNEGVVVRVQGDWALVVYQYDTTSMGQTTRVITTAWMIKSEGNWRQFIVAPRERSFWDKRRADFDSLQSWFDEHAREIVGQADTVIVLPMDDA